MIKKAMIRDIPQIYRLLQEYGNRGELIARPLSELYDHLRDFSVYMTDDRVVGCCALQFCWEDLAEIRSLAVHPDYVGQGIGSRLTENALAEAGHYRIRQVFTLTYRPGFFSRFDFSIIDRTDLPLKIWGGCIHCIKFPDCDETAMMRQMNS